MARSSKGSAQIGAMPEEKVEESGVKVGDTALVYPRPTETPLAHVEPTPAQAGNGAAAATAARPAIRPDESGHVSTEAHKEVRFRIFVIDTGWNSPASKVLRENVAMIRDINDDDEVYVLDREMSIALLRHYPLQVGRDPIITVHDTRAPHRHRNRHTHGFRMHLGILNSEDQVLAALQMFTRFLITHRTAKDLEKVVRANLHQQGITGALEVLGGEQHKKMIEA